MRALIASLGLGLLTALPLPLPLPPAAVPPTAAPNRNTAAGGTLQGGVYTISLETRRAMWYPDGDSLPGRETTAFAEEGKDPIIPGPLIRVAAGTEMRVTVRNSEVDTLRFITHATLRGGTLAAGLDTLLLPPGERRELHVTATTPGNYFYRAVGTDSLSAGLLIHGLLAGAIVVDSAAPARTPNDRVFVLNMSIDSATADGPNFLRTIFSINGRSWPHTERITATVGDTLRWRVINLTNDVHPIHLHGFYYRVDDFASTAQPRDGQEVRGRMVVTERMSNFSRMSMTWVPERAGNWLMHCHFALHLIPPRILKIASLAAFVPPELGSDGAAHGEHRNHAMTGMAGLVMGVMVNPRPGEHIAEPARGRRQLRLVAVQDAGYPDTLPSLRFKLQERATGQEREAGLGFSPPIVLQRGEPVSIMVVNSMREATAVHWHGIELESYFDGVAGFSGFASGISPIIPPRDSFEVRFTPPRAGTFIYHSHVNENRQHPAGLVGALIVLDSARTLPADDHSFLIKAPRAEPFGGGPIEVNGQINPDTVTLHAGRPARLRFIGLSAVNPNATFWLTSRPDSSYANLRDSLVVQWRPLAKDGADLPEAGRQPRLARQTISMGETYDFEFTPPARGQWRIEVRSAGANGVLVARVPLRVE